MKALICDLDGTLCDIRHRLHFVRDGAHDWDGFFAGIPDDLLCAPIAEILSAVAASGGAIVLCSGRPERCRAVTEDWLDRYAVRRDALYMRPDGDSRPDHIVKAQILRGIREDGYEPFLVIDDRQQVVEMWREHDLTCLQCAPNEPKIAATAILTVMVGPTGAGKSTWLAGPQARNEFGIRPHHIISSDQARADLCGDFRDQSKNESVFAAVHAMARTRLRHGLPRAVDATNLRRRDRTGVAALAQGQCAVRYLVIDRPLDQKIKTADWRADVPGLIERHSQTFRSQIKEILAGDGLPNVRVFDLRQPKEMRAAA